MLKWKLKNGDDKLKEEIKRIKEDFDSWFKSTWEKKCTKEKMLSEDSPVYHVYYKMCKPFYEIKEKYPLSAKGQCNCCGEFVDEWIETEFSFCNEYDCGMSLCKDCVEKMVKKFE